MNDLDMWAIEARARTGALGLRLTCERALLKDACGRALFCPCGAVLDCETATLIDATLGDPAQGAWWGVPATRAWAGVFCADCAGAGMDALVAAFEADGWTVELTRGRDLWPPRRPAPRRRCRRIRSAA